MIFLDVTKTQTARHASGLTRVGRRLREELGESVVPVVWPQWDRRVRPDDWFLTPELFSEAERPGLAGFVAERPCRTAAVFHDAIPLQWPHITWPQSVARHPGYMKLLAGFDRVLAVSATSAELLQSFWRWQGVGVRATVDLLPLGSDYDRAPREVAPPDGTRNTLLNVGILEPRKNPLFLLEVARGLWDEGLGFDLHFVGRVNPHFGAPIRRELRRAMRQYPQLFFHEAASDAHLAQLYAQARALVFPTRAEGCGLPVLEALWRGLPVVCSDLPVLQENAAGGGCDALPLEDTIAWANGLRRMLSDDTHWRQRATEARVRPLPTWQETAARVRDLLAE